MLVFVDLSIVFDLFVLLATNASIVSSGVVTVLSPNRVLLENQYLHSETFTFHHISFGSTLVSSCFHVPPGLFLDPLAVKLIFMAS